jgi:hypothetical protein
VTRHDETTRSHHVNRRWPLSQPQILIVATVASIAASAATLGTAPLWVRLVVGGIVGVLISLSVFVWRKARGPLGYFTTWGIEALFWGAVLGVITGVDAWSQGSADVAREVLLGAGSGVLVVAGWAVLIIPARGLIRGARAVLRRSRMRNGSKKVRPDRGQHRREKTKRRTKNSSKARAKRGASRSR